MPPSRSPSPAPSSLREEGLIVTSPVLTQATVPVVELPAARASFLPFPLLGYKPRPASALADPAVRK